MCRNVCHCAGAVHGGGAGAVLYLTNVCRDACHCTGAVHCGGAGAVLHVTNVCRNACHCTGIVHGGGAGRLQAVRHPVRRLWSQVLLLPLRRAAGKLSATFTHLFLDLARFF